MTTPSQSEPITSRRANVVGQSAQLVLAYFFGGRLPADVCFHAGVDCEHELVLDYAPDLEVAFVLLARPVAMIRWARMEAGVAQRQNEFIRALVLASKISTDPDAIVADWIQRTDEMLRNNLVVWPVLKLVEAFETNPVLSASQVEEILAPWILAYKGADDPNLLGALSVRHESKAKP